MKTHYFNEDDPRCKTVFLSYFGPTAYLFTACHRPVEGIKGYTEDIRQVTCKQCLKALSTEKTCAECGRPSESYLCPMCDFEDIDRLEDEK